MSTAPPPTTAAPPRCALCESERLSCFFEAPAVPVHVGVQWPTTAEARACPRGDIRLAICATCGFIRNIAFDPARMAYEGRYENSLHCSPLFQTYARKLAGHLVERYRLRGRDVIELGCGRGEFLAMLVDLGVKNAVGFDPSLDEESIRAGAPAGVRLVPRAFDASDRALPCALVCCRQVLEHIPDPVAFLRVVREAIGERETIAFFEVPDFLFALRRRSGWDIVYEHCSNFGRGSVTAAFAAAGFRTLAVRSYYGEAFLGLEAAPAREPSAGGRDPEEAVAAAGSFAAAWREKTGRWRRTLEDLRTSGRRAVLWGAGARAVTFLNTLPAGEAIAAVVDLNPRKHGRHVAGSGHPIVAPADLAARPPDLVILTNPIYEKEIRGQLQSLGIRSEVMIA